MSSSQDISQSPVAIRASALSPPQISEDPVGLCKTCLEAHWAALRDDGPDWQEVDDGDTPHIETTRGPLLKHKLPADTWPDLPGLLDSAQAGCGFCDFLREAILSQDFKDVWHDLTVKRITEAGRELLGLELQYTSPLSLGYLYPSAGLKYLTVSVAIGNSDLKICLVFRIEANTDCPAVTKWLVLRPRPVRNHEDDAIISFLKTELHKLPDDGNGDFLPERLIDVGTSSLRLVERNNINAGSTKPPQYAALSYCWGPHEHAKSQSKTTSKNRSHHLEKLEFDALSPVLKDAVKITRRLSIPYLWVDSLCILQDNIQEWQRQCSHMNEIYGKARVTLIAASSRTCKEGFLNPTRHGLRIPYQSARRPGINGSFRIRFSHVSKDIKGPLRYPGIYRDFVCSQWARRGWTFQENAMAGARIVFGNTEVYYGRDRSFATKDGYIGREPEPSLPEPVPSLQSDDELHEAWEKVISRYSKFTTSAFTDPKDVLPALSGLARLFGDVLKVDYIAGHWVDRLHHSLMWKDQFPSSIHDASLNALFKRHGQKPYLIPSWSSLARGIAKLGFCIPYECCRSEVTILGVDQELVGENPYGEIENAYLTLEGYVLNLSSLSWSESSWMWKKYVGIHADEDGFDEDGFDEDGFDEDAIWFHRSCFGLDSREIIFTIFDHECSFEDYEFKEYKVTLDFQVEPGDRSQLIEIRTLDQLISRATLLLVGSETLVAEYGRSGVGKAGYGLVLFPLEGASEPSFVRIGIFQPWQAVIGDSDDLPCLKRLMKRERIKIY